jgi:hypothetical protein
LTSSAALERIVNASSYTRGDLFVGDLDRRISLFVPIAGIKDAEEALEAANDALIAAHDEDAEAYQADVDDAEAEVESAKEELKNEQEWETELEELQSARDEIGEWIHGEALIPRDKWEDYCRDLVADIGDLPRDLPGYIENNINWSGVADDLEADYGSLSLNGEDYLFRNC